MLPPVHHYSQVAMTRPRVRERERERARLASARVAEAPRLVAQQLKASRPEDLIPNCDRVMYISVGLQSTRQNKLRAISSKKRKSFPLLLNLVAKDLFKLIYMRISLW